MKDKVKGLAVGILIGSLITGSTALAATNTKLSVVLENVKFMYDGVHKQTSQSIIYNGQLYAPVKNIAQGLNEAFTYDGRNKTAWIGTKTGSTKYLDELSYARIDGDYKRDVYFKNWTSPDGLKFKIADNQYLHGIGVIMNSYVSNKDNRRSIDYNLNGKYKNLTGYFGVDDYTKDSDRTGSLIVYGDGVELFRKEGVKGGDLPTLVNVDLSGVLKLQIAFECSGDSYNQLDLVLGEAKLMY